MAQCSVIRFAALTKPTNGLSQNLSNMHWALIPVLLPVIRLTGFFHSRRRRGERAQNARSDAPHPLPDPSCTSQSVMGHGTGTTSTSPSTEKNSRNKAPNTPDRRQGLHGQLPTILSIQHYDWGFLGGSTCDAHVLFVWCLSCDV